MNKLAIKMTTVASMAIVGSVAWAAEDPVPEVTSVTMTQVNRRKVTIDYTLANAPAVITLDIETNGPNGWVSIGGEHIQNVTGDCWIKVAADAHSITWDPSADWPDHKVEANGCRAVVKAWALDNPPDYMAVDISASATQGDIRWYPNAESVPGGVLSNKAYRTTTLLLRKIPAKNVTWTMGSVHETGRTSDREATHAVTLADNYYIGVFEITQSQWDLVNTPRLVASVFTTERSMRPVDYVNYYELRCYKDYNKDGPLGGIYPAPPYDKSYLGLLRTKTGLAFDMPSEAQWEFACRAGNGEGYWGDGSPYLGSPTDSNLPGRYSKNGGFYPSFSTKDYSVGPTNGTAIVGSYAPNSWGIYDMHGNVREYVLDKFTKDISSLGGAVNTASADTVVVRGGYISADSAQCRSAYRGDEVPSKRVAGSGVRVACPARCPTTFPDF